MCGWACGQSVCKANDTENKRAGARAEEARQSHFGGFQTRVELRWRCGLRSDGRKVEVSIPGSDIELLEAVLILQMTSEAWMEQSESHLPDRPRKIVLMYGDKTEKRVAPQVGIEPPTSCPSDWSPQSPPKFQAYFQI